MKLVGAAGVGVGFSSQAAADGGQVFSVSDSDAAGTVIIDSFEDENLNGWSEGRSDFTIDESIAFHGDASLRKTHYNYSILRSNEGDGLPVYFPKGETGNFTVRTSKQSGKMYLYWGMAPGSGVPSNTHQLLLDFGSGSSTLTIKSDEGNDVVGGSDDVSLPADVWLAVSIDRQDGNDGGEDNRTVVTVTDTDSDTVLYTDSYVDERHADESGIAFLMQGEDGDQDTHFDYIHLTNSDQEISRGEIKGIYTKPTRDQLPQLSADETPAVGITDQGIFAYDAPSSSWVQFTDEPILNARETDEGYGLVDRPLQTTESRTIHVDAETGSDDGRGTEDDPLATVQEAFNRTPVFINHEFTIDLADGEYLSGKDNFATRTGLHFVWAGDNFTLLGNTENPENVVLNALNAKFFGKHEDCQFRGFSVKYLTQFAGPAWVRDCRFLGKRYRDSSTAALSGKNGQVDIGRCQIGNRDDPPDYAIMPSLYDNYLLKSSTVYANDYVVDNSYSKQARVQISANTEWETDYGLAQPGSGTLFVYDETIYVGGFTTVADDFNDDRLTDRITMNGGGHGGYRPEWTDVSDAYAARGELILSPDGSNEAVAAVPSPIGVGTWEFDLSMGEDRTPPHANNNGGGPDPRRGSFSVYFNYAADGDAYYRLQFGYDGDLVLEKKQPKSSPEQLTSGSWTVDGSRRWIVINRDRDGTMTVSVDGTEELAHVDEFQPRASGEQLLRLESDLDTAIRVDNVRIEQE